MSRTRLPRTGHFLREWRECRGYVLKDVEEFTGIRYTSLGRIERGLYPYNQRHLEKLAELYRTTPADLLSVNPLLHRGRFYRARSPKRRP